MVIMRGLVFSSAKPFSPIAIFVPLQNPRLRPLMERLGLCGQGKTPPSDGDAGPIVTAAAAERQSARGPPFGISPAA